MICLARMFATTREGFHHGVRSVARAIHEIVLRMAYIVGVAPVSPLDPCPMLSCDNLNTILERYVVPSSRLHAPYTPLTLRNMIERCGRVVSSGREAYQTKVVKKFRKI